MGDPVPTIYDSNVRWFEDWKKRMRLDSNRRKLLVRDVQIRPLVNVPKPEIIEDKIPVDGRYVCEPGEHILIDFELGIMVVSDES